MTSRGPRSDLRLLRQASQAAKGNPSAGALRDLHDAGDAILGKIQKIKSFVKSQRSRTEGRSAKHEWTTALQRLNAEEDTAERDLLAAIESFSGEAGPLRADAEEFLGSGAARDALQEELAGVVHGARAMLRASGTGGQALIRVRLAIGEARACLDHAGRSLAAEWDAAVASEASVEVDEHRGGAAEDLAVLGCEEEDATRWTGLRAEVEDLLSRAVGWAPPSTLDGIREAATSVESRFRHAVRRWQQDAAAVGQAGEWFPDDEGGGGDGDWEPLSGADEDGEGSHASTSRSEREPPLLDHARDATAKEGRRAGAPSRAGTLQSGASRRTLTAQCTGGWPAEEHQRFVQMRRTILAGLGKGPSAGTGGALRDALISRLHLLLPHYSAAELSEHEAWFQRLRLVRQRHVDLGAAWDREKAAVLRWARGVLDEAESGLGRGAREALDAARFEAQRAQLHADLESLREKRAQREAEAEAGRLAREAREEARRQRQEEARRAEMAQKKALLSDYREERERAAMEELARAEAQRRADEERLAEEGKHHRERVQYRQAVQAARDEEAARRQLAREAEEAERQRRLDALRALVAVEAEADFARLVGHTESSRATAEAAAAEAAGAKAPPVHGYTNEQLMRDPRFRLLTALHERGLTAGHAGSYAAEVLARTGAARATRVDNLTSAQIDHYARAGLPL